jgi:hypothetical protein
VETLPFVYLSSTPFSGSTLFSFLANTHPDLATVGEMTGLVKSEDPETYDCSCGFRIRKCPFWRQVADRMKARGFSFEPGAFDTRIHLGNSPFAQRLLNSSMGSTALEDCRDWAVRTVPHYNNRLKYLVARNKALAASVLDVTGRTVFFDASKPAGVIRHLSREPDLDLRVVHLVRDVRGVSVSRVRNKGETDWRRIVNNWLQTNANIERQLERLPRNRWIRLRYEDICSAPLKTLNRFFEFCGLAPLDPTAAFHHADHHIVGNRMRLSGLEMIRLDESWRRKLTSDQQGLIESLAATTHARYGYAPMDDSELVRESR